MVTAVLGDHPNQHPWVSRLGLHLELHQRVVGVTGARLGKDEITLHPGEHSRAVAGASTGSRGLGIFREGPVEDEVDPAPTLAEVAAQIPEPPESGSEPLGRPSLRVAVLTQRATERSSQVVMLELQATEPGALVFADEPVLGLARKVDDQARCADCADDASPSAASRSPAYSRIVSSISSRGRSADSSMDSRLASSSDSRSSRQSARRYAGRSQRRTRRGRPSIVRARLARPHRPGHSPLHNRAHRAVTFRVRAAASGQHVQVQASSQIRGREQTGPRGGQLDRQRHAVQAFAQLGNRRGIRLGPGSAYRRRTNPEELDRKGRRQWPQAYYALTGHPQGSPARDEHGRVWPEGGNELANRVDDVLGVVEHDQPMVVLLVSTDRVQRLGDRLRHLERRRDVREDDLRVIDTREIDPHGRRRPLSAVPFRELLGQSGLAHSAWPDQGDPARA